MCFDSGLSCGASISVDIGPSFEWVAALKQTLQLVLTPNAMRLV